MARTTATARGMKDQSSSERSLSGGGGGGDQSRTERSSDAVRIVPSARPVGDDGDAADAL